MFRFTSILFIYCAILSFSGISGYAYCNPPPEKILNRSADTIAGNQILYNGRVWRNKYFYIKGDPYFLSSAMVDGSVTVNNKTFKNLRLQYDIYNDELLALTNRNLIIQLNKEIIDEFTISFENREYNFLKISGEEQLSPQGYVNILFDGTTSLWIKYFKTVEPRAIENKYDSFFQSHRIYINRDGKSTLIRNRKQFFDLLADRKRELKEYVRERKIRISVRQPDSFTPVIEYYNILNQKK